MITREQIHELAQFEDPAGCALSYYFQPSAPSNKAHKGEAILTKDLAREALHRLEDQRSDKCPSAREDLDRIVRLSRQRQPRQSGFRLRGAKLLARIRSAGTPEWHSNSGKPSLPSQTACADSRSVSSPRHRARRSSPGAAIRSSPRRIDRARRIFSSFIPPWPWRWLCRLRWRPRRTPRR